MKQKWSEHLLKEWTKHHKGEFKFEREKTECTFIQSFKNIFFSVATIPLPSFKALSRFLSKVLLSNYLAHIPFWGGKTKGSDKVIFHLILKEFQPIFKVKGQVQ